MAGTKLVTFPECKSGLAKGKNAGAVLWLAIFTFILVAVVFLIKPVEVFGASVHGPFSSTTDKCSSCHRMHDSQGAKLISQTTLTGLCLSCHAKGQSADTDVLDGIYLDAQNAGHGWGVANGTLLGGGFDYVGQSQPVTGRHTIGLAAVPYGSETGQVFTLGCVDCHTPHQGPNYRLLRQRPGAATSNIAVTWNGPWTDTSQTTRGGDYAAYTETDFSSSVLGESDPVEYTRNYQSGLSAWCSGCHNVYVEPASSYDIGDGFGGTVKRRHKVDITLTNTEPLTGTPATDLPLNDLTGNGRTNDDTMSCVTCHRAHGTDSDTTAVGAYQAASRGFLPPMTTSMLLRRGNRGVCIDCHGYLNK